MSAAARGAAGFRYMHDRRRAPATVDIKPHDGELEAFVQSLVRKGITEVRARELAAEQSAKTFQRARSGARR